MFSEIFKWVLPLGTVAIVAALVVGLASEVSKPTLPTNPPPNYPTDGMKAVPVARPSLFHQEVEVGLHSDCGCGVYAVNRMWGWGTTISFWDSCPVPERVADDQWFGEIVPETWYSWREVSFFQRDGDFWIFVPEDWQVEGQLEED